MSAALRGLTALGVALVLAGAGLTVAGAASAAPTPHRLLELAVSGAPSGGIAPGDRRVWPITVTLDAPTTGRLSLRVVASEPLTQDPGGLRFSLQSCDVAWTVSDPATASCASGRRTLLSEAPLASMSASTTHALGTIRPDQTRFYLGTLTLPADRPDAIASAAGQVDLAFAATEIAATPGGGTGDTSTDDSGDGTDGSGSDDGSDDGSADDGTDDVGSVVSDLIRGSGGGAAGGTGVDPASAIGGLSDWGFFSAFGFGKLAFAGPLLLALGLVLLVFIVILARRRRRDDEDEAAGVLA